MMVGWWLASSEVLRTVVIVSSQVFGHLRSFKGWIQSPIQRVLCMQRDAWTPNLPLLALVPTNTYKIPVLESMLEKTVGYVLSEIIWKRNQICIIILDTLSLKVTASNLLSAVGVLNVNPKKWKKESLVLTEFVVLTIINPHSRAVMILDSSYHGYCGHKDSRYRYIAICLAILGGGYISQIIFYFVYWVFLFHPTDLKILINAGHDTLAFSVFLELLWNTVTFNCMINKY